MSPRRVQVDLSLPPLIDDAHRHPPDVTASGGQVDWGEGLRVWERLNVSVDRPEWPFLVRVDAALEGGRMVAERVEVSRRPGGPPVDGGALREVPVASLVAAASGAAVVTMGWVGGLSSAADIRDLPLSARHRAVATLYRVALLSGWAPTQTIAEDIGVSRATAGRWIAAARRAGLIDSEADDGEH